MAAELDAMTPCAGEADMTLPRVGIGVDVHPVEEGRECWLAGLFWPNVAGLRRALRRRRGLPRRLRRAAVGGRPGRSRCGVRHLRPAVGRRVGVELLAEVVRRLAAASWRIGNVAVQLIGNRPKLGPRRLDAEALLSDVVGAPVTLSATTTDGLGLTGRGEGLAAVATALIAR